MVVKAPFCCPRLWPIWPKDDRRREIKSVNIFVGFFFVINFCLGTGFLGVPYAFFNAGYLAAIPTFLLIAFAAWNTGRWEIEVMARAQAVETFNQSQEMSDSEDDTGQFISDESVKLDQKSDNHPNFEILLTRKFEVSELCEIFFNRWVKYLYILLVAMAGYLACWSFSTVAASAWASNIPLNFGTLRQCGPQAFHHRVLPIGEGLDGCLEAYYFCLLLFAVIVIPLSLLELKEQAIVQMSLGLLRFLTVAAIIIYCIVKLIQVGDICLPLGNETLSNTSAISNATIDYSNISHTVERLKLRDIVVKFNWEGWLTSVPVFTYAFIVHQGIPSLTHPIKQKQYFRLLIGIVFASIAFSYFSLGIVAPLWFRASIQETVTLNWSRLTGPGNPTALRVFSFYLIFFPSLDVCSAFPLVLQATTNNLYCLLTGRDTSEEAKNKYDWLLRLFLRLIVAVLAILAAFGIANLVRVLKYGGLVGFGVFGFPALLQFQSIRVCKKLFGAFLATQKESLDMSTLKQEQRRDSDDGKGGVENSTEVAPLIATDDAKDVKVTSLYMTPYSNPILSHPIAALVIGVMIIVFFLLTVFSLFVQPVPETGRCIVSS